jgi:hypothetical protein
MSYKEEISNRQQNHDLGGTSNKSSFDFVHSHELGCTSAILIRNVIRCVPLLGLLTSGLFSLGRSFYSVSLNENLVSPPTSLYPYKAYIEILLSYGPAAKESQLTGVMWYKDTPGHQDKRTTIAE